MSKHMAKNAITTKIALASGAMALVLSALTPLAAHAAVPGLTSVSPSSGTAAGGTTITITGTGFTGVLCPAGVTLGGVAVQSCTVDSGTQITAVLPTRAGSAKTIGPQEIQVVHPTDGTSVAGSLRYTYIPVVDSSKTNENLVILGDLASRSQRKLVTRSTSTPYQVNGTDSLTNSPYSYITNYAYDASNHALAYAREGDQPGYHQNAGTPSLSTKSVTSETYGGRSTQHMRSNGSCGRGNNTFDSGSGAITTYCTVFGPEIYSEAFYATSAQALAFEWKALGNTDDYSVYGFLVSVTDDTTIPTASTSNNTLVMHGVGSRTVAAPANAADGWTTSTANVNSNGLYRFRFVNGSFDGTGGMAIGSDFYISAVFLAGDKNELTLNSPGDQVYNASTNAGPWTTTANATSQQAVTVSSLTTGVCTVTTSGSNPTSISITRVADGTCTLQASQGATGNYAPAATVRTSFDILANATAPGAPTITAVTNLDTQVTVAVNRPNRDGGSPITKYQYQLDGGTWVDLPLVNNDVPSPFTITGLTNGTTYQIKVRAVNAVGDGASSGQYPGTPVGSGSSSNSSGGSSGGGSGGGTTPPVVVKPAPAKRPPVTITIGGFKPGSPVLTKQIQAAIKQFIAKNPGYKSVIATGVTDGPTVLKVDKTLSKTRATNALAFLTKTLKAPVKVAEVKAKQETKKGSNVRRVVLTLTD